MERITEAEAGLNIDKLEKKVSSFLSLYPTDTIELTDLSETAYDLLKKYFGEGYVTEGIINVLRTEGNEINYTLHIKRKE